MAEPVPDITCKGVVELVTDFLEGALPPDVARQVEEHLDDCEGGRGCRRYFEQMRVTIAAVGRTAEDEEVPPELLDRLRGTFRRWKAG